STQYQFTGNIVTSYQFAGGTGVQHTITNLTPNTTYYIDVDEMALFSAVSSSNGTLQFTTNTSSATINLAVTLPFQVKHVISGLTLFGTFSVTVDEIGTFSAQA